MKALSDVGQLLYLYLEEIIPDDEAQFSDFIIEAGAKLLQNGEQRNWVPLIVKQVGDKQYQVIANSLVYAIAEAAGVDRIWCILADDSSRTKEISRVLCGESIAKINLSKASHDEIYAAFQYLLSLDQSPLKGVKVQIATTRIDESPRQYWKDFTPIIQLKCGITKGKKLDALKEIFYLQPEVMPDIVKDISILTGMTTTALKVMAKKQGITGYSKLKKDDLVKQISQS
jgi:Rho termination factor, N-terminal domain